VAGGRKRGGVMKKIPQSREGRLQILGNRGGENEAK